MEAKYLGLILAGVSLFTSATQVTIYRWVDDKNVVHFSQQQPKHNNYTELSMSSPVQSKPSTVATSEKQEELTDAEIPLQVEDAKNKCEEAKANIQTLSTYDKIQYKDNNGSVKILGKKQKQQQLEVNKKQVEVYCQG
ncbi:MAG: DUF4124 domain-containing protein [Thalassotalea sp.]